MTDIVLQALQSAKDQNEKAAIIAELIFTSLPEMVALAGRRCVILHWFDQFIVENILGDCELTLDQMSEVYEQLEALPFIDILPWGLTFQETTRQGFLKHYSTTNSEALKTAARMAAPAYEANEQEKRNIAEAFFCYIVAEDQASSTALQSILFEDASKHQDWHFLDNLLQLQAEAESFPFVRPLPRNEKQLLLQGLVHRIKGKEEDALLDYQQALTINPKSALAFVSLGTTHAEQGHDKEALIAYNTALRLDNNFAPAYLSRGVLYLKQTRYKEALRDINKAQSLGLNTDAIFMSKGNIFNTLGQYEDAIAAYDQAIRLNPNDPDAYYNKGLSLDNLGRYHDAIAAYDQAIRLNPNHDIAYYNKDLSLRYASSKNLDRSKSKSKNFTRRKARNKIY